MWFSMQIASIGSVVIWAKHICYNNNKIYLSLADILKLCILLAHTSIQMYVCK